MKNANPPAGTGPRHIAYHPTKSIIYFSNEQHLGVSAYDITKSGTLKLRQVCDAVDKKMSKRWCQFLRHCDHTRRTIFIRWYSWT